MFAVIKGFLHDWLRLLYWVFFKPTALRAHLREIAPEWHEPLKIFRAHIQPMRTNLEQGTC